MSFYLSYYLVILYDWLRNYGYTKMFNKKHPIFNIMLIFENNYFKFSWGGEQEDHWPPQKVTTKNQQQISSRVIDHGTVRWFHSGRDRSKLTLSDYFKHISYGFWRRKFHFKLDFRLVSLDLFFQKSEAHDEFVRNQDGFLDGFVRIQPGGQVMPRCYLQYHDRVRNFKVNEDDIWIYEI